MYHGVWGGVYGNGINNNVGHVVCRQLGYSGANEIFTRAVFGRVKGPLWIQKIQCNGNETKISDCAVTTSDNVPNHYQQNPIHAAGVICNETNSTSFEGKLSLRHSFTERNDLIDLQEFLLQTRRTRSS